MSAPLPEVNTAREQIAYERGSRIYAKMQTLLVRLSIASSLARSNNSDSERLAKKLDRMSDYIDTECNALMMLIHEAFPEITVDEKTKDSHTLLAAFHSAMDHSTDF
jgi:hypothetical protein